MEMEARKCVMQLIVADTSLSFHFLCFYLLCSPPLCLSVFCFSFFFSFLGSERENGMWMGMGWIEGRYEINFFGGGGVVDRGFEGQVSVKLWFRVFDME